MASLNKKSNYDSEENQNLLSLIQAYSYSMRNYKDGRTPEDILIIMKSIVKKYPNENEFQSKLKEEEPQIYKNFKKWLKNYQKKLNKQSSDQSQVDLQQEQDSVYEEEGEGEEVDEEYVYSREENNNVHSYPHHYNQFGIPPYPFEIQIEEEQRIQDLKQQIKQQLEKLFQINQETEKLLLISENNRSRLQDYKEFFESIIYQSQQNNKNFNNL